MRYHRKTAMMIALAAALPLGATVARAQEVEHHQTVTRSKIVRTVPGHVSTNKVRVVHVHKVVHVPPRPHGPVHHTTVTRTVRKTSSSGPAPDHR